MKTRPVFIACACLLLLCAMAWGWREARYRAESRRRRHQIGQLWMFCVLYYCPAHGQKFPGDLAELKALPQYTGGAREYWDRAFREVELVAPGVNRDKAGPFTVALRDKSTDERGLRYVCLLDGACVAQR